MSHNFDSELYQNDDKKNLSRTVVEDNDENEEDFPWGSRQVRIGPSRELLNDMRLDGGETDAELQARYRERYGSGLTNTKIADRRVSIISAGSSAQEMCFRRTVSRSQLQCLENGSDQGAQEVNGAGGNEPKARSRRSRWGDPKAEGSTSTSLPVTLSEPQQWEDTPLEVAIDRSAENTATLGSRWGAPPSLDGQTTTESIPRRSRWTSTMTTMTPAQWHHKHLA